MTLLDFMHAHVIVTVLALLVCSHAVHAVLFRLPNRWLRSRNIREQGWPPEHLDADGDFKENDS